MMPYNSTRDLPDSVRDHLPEHAQEIYRAAFNNALKEYGESDEARAHRVAWAAVKNEYEKDEKNGQWHRKAESAKR
ncbi:MAG TPA: ChaB family protein [Aggregatilineales bacterium]|nr:ChaB family protein [Aggregatilineales bacterium]